MHITHPRDIATAAARLPPPTGDTGEQGVPATDPLALALNAA